MPRYRCAVLPIVALIAALPGHATITYTCDPNVEAAHAGACAYLNSTIAGFYGNTFTNVNASIYVQLGATALGSSRVYLDIVPYSRYLAALTATSQTSGNATQISAVKALNNASTAIYGNYQVVVPTSLGRAFGFSNLPGTDASANYCSTPGQGKCYDGIITISNAASLFYRSGNEAFNQFDF